MKKVQYISATSPTVDFIMQGADYSIATPRTDGITWTTTGVAFGDEDAKRDIVIVLFVKGQTSGSFPTLTGITIGGVTASIDIDQLNLSHSNYYRVVIAKARVPLGTSGTVVWTMSSLLNDQSAGALAVYRCTRLRSGLINADKATDINPISVTLNAPTKGVLIAGAICERAGVPASLFQWSGGAKEADGPGLGGFYAGTAILGGFDASARHELLSGGAASLDTEVMISNPGGPPPGHTALAAAIYR